MMQRQTSLSANVVQFCRFLRSHNFMVGVEEEATVLSALHLLDYSNQPVFKLALKTVLCRSRQELLAYDDLFNEYWKELAKAIDSKVKTKAEPKAKPGSQDKSFKALKTWLNGNRNEQLEQTASYSYSESLSKKDFSLVSADEMEELVRSIKALSRRLAAQLNRRYQKSGKVSLPDLRRTLRKNMRNGGELIEIQFRKPKRNRTRLVVLCDVSKSMDLYSSFLLQFMFAFQQVYPRISTFTFSTSLQYITPLLKQNDFKTALRSISTESNSWSAGTRIGESLHKFVEDYGRRVLDKRTIVIILSDGWDTGAISLLEESMRYIQKTSKKIIWLNPLAGYASYRPEVAGMQIAMKYVDVFAPVHNVDSLKNFSKWL
jgi:uncharacterized protein with von Willebrand factor type A (vWA) domain